MSGRMLRTFIASPTFTAMPSPCSAWSVGSPRRYSLPSSTSSWTRNALWKNSIVTADWSTLSTVPPNARHVPMQSPGRSPFPGRFGYEETRS